MLVGFGAAVGGKPHVLIKPDGLRVLLVDGELAHAVPGDAVFQQAAAEALPARGGGEEQHFEPPVLNAHKAYRRPGVVLGAIILYAIPEALRIWARPVQEGLFGHEYIAPEALRMLLFGLAMVLIMLFRPHGLWPPPTHGRRLALPPSDKTPPPVAPAHPLPHVAGASPTSAP